MSNIDTISTNATQNDQVQTQTSANKTKLVQTVFHKGLFTSKNNGEWQRDQVPTAKRRKPDSSPNNRDNTYNVNVETFNSFDQLEDEEAGANGEGGTLPKKHHKSQPAIQKPEPIFVTGVQDVMKLKELLCTIITDTSKYKIATLRNGHIVKIIPSDVDSYKTIRNQFVTQNVSHYTYQLKHERAFRVVIRGIHASEDVSFIKTELEALGHQVRNVTNALHRQTKQPLPLYYVNLEPNANNKDAYKIKHIGNLIVTVEAPYKKQEIIQCKRCQRFGHSKNNCNRIFRCVKCGEDHPTNTCTKKSDTAAVCVNCQGSHPANYKGCTKYKQYKEQIFNKTNPKTRTYQNASNKPTTSSQTPQGNSNDKPCPPTSASQNNKLTYSYAEAAKNEVPLYSRTDTDNSLPSTPPLEEIFTRFEKTIERMLDKLMDRMIDLISTIIMKSSS